MLTETNKTLSLFSKHLFWDTARQSLDMERDRSYIIRQVLEYGLLSDWIRILKHYGLAVITEEAKKYRELDKKAVAFLSFLSDIPKEEFRCYKNMPSNQRHYPF